ncbi:hypothetical protein F0562_019738 [Nyssa sinensis]|uniref:Uncharacterized protein n=1 Tax=Nyssa sinensis TaxID=561372 RepID=A0A5J5BSW4_9ASTE|nr:hypothetical protein F0562_019738 [Nyssa sinensis]
MKKKQSMETRTTDSNAVTRDESTGFLLQTIDQRRKRRPWWWLWRRCWISVVLGSATEYSDSIAEYERRWSEDDDVRTTKGQRSVFCVHRYLVMFRADWYREAMEIDDGRRCLLIEMIRFDCGRSPKNVDNFVGLEFSGDRVIG